MARMQGAVRLPPGFRFQPTDEELIVEYLRRKVFSVPMPAFVIPVVQISRCDPWDIPGEEREKYFFSSREMKYPKSSRSNRSSGAGFWKATGKERQIFSSRGKQIIGSKMTLVFYLGKSSSGERTDWIMHEYRLAAAEEDQTPERRDWVLCRVFRKRKPSPSRERLIDFMAAESDSEASCVTEISGEVSGEVSGEDSGCSSPSSEWREAEKFLELR